ncbi:dedicator of cytokinesis protein 3 isoform X5 [Oncorhynchus kisutch]|uniref:dedicator of cytokinesis protein 3 isoform X5 n=1 Tax=Oncorhynchus kisutch TaxID=8019 RepID=UPI0012DE5B5E|nr:dedicator of cytokinesis protein 3-like isoform X5 [Oncorhynchus kisutch]
MVDADQISVSDLYKMHLSSRHSVQQSTTQADSVRRSHGVEPCRIPVPHHLFVSLKSFTYNTMGEDTDVFFSLYDLREGKQISEKFMVRLNKNEGPKNTDKVDRLCALFTDLSNKDMKRDLYIVSQVIRTGRMLLNDSKKGPPHVQYRRPYGCAVLAMSDILQTISELKEEKDFVLKVYTCNNENEWYQIHENIIRKSSTKYTAPSTNYGLIISLQLLRGEMEQIRRENPMIFNRGVAITRKLGFPDVIMPGDIRNDLYLTLERGDFERGGKSVQKNIEVSVYVLYADGEILKDCISLGSGEPHISEHRSFVLYHNNSPRWSEVVKLPIPIDRFRGSHLRFEFRHCSTKDKAEKKLFGFAFTPLMREDGTTLSDESHELYVYKCDENATFSNHALYLGLPCCKEDFNGCPNIPSSLIFQRSTKETLWISTQLSSTKLTQNVDLLALLKWKAHPDRVMDILGRLRHVSGEEIVKFLQDILDTLFSILDDNTDQYGPLVFQSLVFIINLLRDSKYYHFRPVMDTYIQKHFAGALAYKELIRCLKWYMDRSAEVVKQDHIQEAMRALEYLLKFIIQSRILYSRATCGMEEEQFRTSIQELFQSIRFVLSLDSRSSETLIFTQAALLNSFPAIFDELLQMFTVQEVAEFVRGTLGSMPSTVHIGQSMDVVKLQSIARTVDSRLFSFPESRRILLPVVLHHIHLHLRQQKELLICSGILSSIFSIIKTSSLDTPVQEDIEMMVESLLDVLLQTLLAIMSKSQSQEAVRGQRCPQCTAEITGEYVSCLLSLLRQMSEIHFQHLLDNFQSKEELKEFLLKIFCVFRNLMKLSVFPRDWNVMRLLTSNIIVTTAQCLSPALNKNFTEADFDFKVWNSYFSLAVLYINQPSLQLENTTPAKRKNVLDKYGDMRVMMAYELFSMWQNLGENKIHFIPGMIGPFLGVTLVPQGEVRNIMIPIFHDMMDWEQRKNGNFKQVEAELIDKLDSLVSEGKGDENYRELFSLLTQLFGPYPSLLEKIEQETWRETGISFVTSVTRLMERLLDYRDCMKGDETENKKIGCTVNLLNFYKSEINKEEMYIRYIHKLCGMHLQAENYTEAAFTLLLYWELLHWEERPLREFLHYPAQSEWHRKEGLCRKVINYFNKGKCWEYGIPLCRELAYQYETLYDYQSLSWIRKMEAAYYDNIMEQQRLEPEFFRVGFYGRKFPFFLRNKEFVCRGHDYERLEAFQQRMLGEFPQAIAMQHPNQPDEAILQCDAQYLQIYAVSAVPENVNVLQMDRVPDRIKSFYRVNNVRRFRYDRPFHKGSKDRENEFKSLWIERTTLILTHPLPGISRWFEVEKRELIEVSPLENAIYVVENKNHELRTLISQYQHKQLHGNINLLSMCLNGVIDAAVNGGIARYQEAFFDKEYIGSHAEDTEKITSLKDLMQEQVHILGAGLAVHDKLVHPEMRPLHKKLIDQFQMMRSSLYGLPGLDKLSPACSGASTPRGILATHSPMSPDSFKVMHRHSPLNLLGSIRHSSSSLSSHTSSETGNLVILTDGMVVEHPEDVYRMQVCLHARVVPAVPTDRTLSHPSPSSSSLSSTHSAPSQMVNSSSLSSTHSAPSQMVNSSNSIRVGSPSLPDKYRNNREMLMLLPPHRERPSSAMYPNITENGQGLPGLDKLSPACSGASTPRGILATHSPMSPDSFKVMHRHSPLNLLGSIRHSSSSLSSHTSSETGNLVILTDGMVVEHPEDVYRMQVCLHARVVPAVPTDRTLSHPSPSSSSLSSTHSAPSQMVNSSSLSSTHSAPSQMVNSSNSIRVGSPSLPDKYRNNREMLMLLPPHRERPSSAMYPNITENGQVQPTNFQRALFHQVIGPCKPCSDPNLSVAEKVLTTPSSWSLDSGTREVLPFLSAHVGSVMAPPVPPRSLPHGHFSMHFDAFHHQNSDLPPALPARSSLRKSALHPIPASPTSPQSQSGLDGSNSTLSGSASSGVSSLSESNFMGQSCSTESHGTTRHPADALDTVSVNPSMAHSTWATDGEDLGMDSPSGSYLPVLYSVSESEILDGSKPPPCRSHSSPVVITPLITNIVVPISPVLPEAHTLNIQNLPHYRHQPPPALPPKPYLREGCIPEEEGCIPARPMPMPRKISQPLITSKEEQAKVAWEHGIAEE